MAGVLAVAAARLVGGGCGAGLQLLLDWILEEEPSDGLTGEDSADLIAICGNRGLPRCWVLQPHSCRSRAVATVESTKFEIRIHDIHGRIYSFHRDSRRNCTGARPVARRRGALVLAAAALAGEAPGLLPAALSAAGRYTEIIFSRRPMPHTVLECQVSNVINSDTCPRPTTGSPRCCRCSPRPWRWAQGSVALSLCTAAHPLYTRIANIFGASIYETTMRPNPRWTAPPPLAGRTRASPPRCSWPCWPRCRRAGWPAPRTAATTARLGLGRIVGLYYCSSTSY